jgi:putative PEP-CTERM system histidine kinase
VTVPLLAVLSSLGLVGLVLVRRPLERLHWTIAGILGALAAESMAAFMLLTAADSQASQVLWLNLARAAGLLVLPAGVAFVAALFHPADQPLSWGWRVGLAGGLVLMGGTALTLATAPTLQFPAPTDHFTHAGLGGFARTVVVLELLVTVGILVGLEAGLRTSRGTTRARLKYLVLGLGAILLVRFSIMTQTLLFQSVTAEHFRTSSATLFLGNAVIAFALVRDRLRGVELALSRQMLYRTVIVAVLGVYLFVVGGLGWVLRTLKVPEQSFWGMVVVFVATLVLAVSLVSDRVRWRVKRSIVRHFYRSRYDYREHWVAFTGRLGSLVSVDELGPRVIEAMTEAVGTATGALYLADEHRTRYQLSGALGSAPWPSAIGADDDLPTRLERQRHAIWYGGERLASNAALSGPPPSLLPDVIAVPLVWRGALMGFMLIGPERTGEPYTPEDIEFMGTVAAQAAGSIMTARLSETVARARAFEAFDRVSAQVMHDLKNSVSALAMLGENASKHGDDPEFQRDTITTLSRTTDRMRRLLVRLSMPVDTGPGRFEPVDLSSLVRDVVRPWQTGPDAQLVEEIEPVPAVAGDAEALHRVVENLVTNAVEALEGRGTVTVKLRAEGDRVVLTVADTGPGIPAEYLRRSLFAPFRSTKKGGWGIGLYQTKQTVERHAGSIEVETAEGRGTTFSVRLPLSTGAPRSQR